MRVNLACILLLAGCGDYVRYEKPMGGGGGPGAGSLDEATRMRLADADHLDHLAFDAVLTAYVVPAGEYTHLDYTGLAADDEALLLLDQYLATLDAVSPEKLRDGAERLAYWVNGYNAHVIRAVLDAWGGDPAYSVSEGGFIVFDTPAHHLGGRTFTLNQIEHAIIRGDETHAAFTSADDALKAELRALHTSLWSGAPVDARIHIALNCASLSCPNLLTETPHVFRAEVLESQLDRATRAFCASAAKGAGPSGVSQIFNWFAADFEPVYGNAAGFIRQHREMGLTGVNLDLYLRYDWSLNIAPPE